MKAEPAAWQTTATEFVAARGTINYQEAASILADLGEAIGGDTGGKLARTHAIYLIKEFPGLNMLKSSLRKRQLLD